MPLYSIQGFPILFLVLFLYEGVFFKLLEIKYKKPFIISSVDLKIKTGPRNSVTYRLKI